MLELYTRACQGAGGVGGARERLLFYLPILQCFLVLLRDSVKLSASEEYPEFVLRSRGSADNSPVVSAL